MSIRATMHRSYQRHGCLWTLSGVILVACVGTIGAKEGPAAPREWAQWRGPMATGVAPEGNPPTKWSETENVKWKVKLPGNGSGTPIIWGDRIFLLTAVATAKKGDAAPTQPPAGNNQRPQGQGRGGFGGASAPTEPYQFAVLCLDRATGKEKWQKVLREEKPHEGHHRDHGFASYSPITDGETLYVFFGSRGLYALDFDGNVKWKKDLGKMRTRNSFGEGSSPALFGDALVVNWDHEGDDDFIAAFNKKTGDEIWRQPRAEATTWMTPLIVQHDGKAQVITSASGKIRSYDLATGKQIWECSGLTSNVIPSPVVKDGTVYVMSGHRGNALLAIKLGRTGDLTGTDAVTWKLERNTPYVPSPLLYENRLYFFSANNALVSCYDATTGKALYGPERIDALQGVYASPVGAAGKVYLVGRNGTSVVIKHGDKFEQLATNKLDDRIDASPAIVGKELYLRGHEHLYCIVEK